MANTPGFIHLHIHSQYSLLEGALKLGTLLDRAAAALNGPATPRSSTSSTTSTTRPTTSTSSGGSQALGARR